MIHVPGYEGSTTDRIRLLHEIPAAGGNEIAQRSLVRRTRTRAVIGHVRYCGPLTSLQFEPPEGRFEHRGDPLRRSRLSRCGLIIGKDESCLPQCFVKFLRIGYRRGIDQAVLVYRHTGCVRCHVTAKDSQLDSKDGLFCTINREHAQD